MDELVAEGYPRAVVEHVTAAGAACGHRLAGSPGDMAAASYVAGQMRSIGLQSVRSEAIPVDVWDTRGAEVLGLDAPVAASQWAGVPGTPPDGVTGDLVYVRGGEADDFAAAGDVTGRIVLVDLLPSSHWIAIVGMEAFERGAAAMIVTSTRADTAMFAGRDLLAASNATYSTSGAVPFVYVSRRDGDRLKRAVAAGPLVVSIRSDVRITPLADGGNACNVLGELPGTSGQPQLLVIGAHHDGYFEGTIDNASGVAALLTLASAMTRSGWVPERTIMFVSHTAEEFGLADSPYDWCIGSWRLLQMHDDWPGRVSAELEIDEVGYHSQPLWALNSPELGPWLRGSIDRPRARLWPHDSVTSFSDQWAYSARGVPSIHFGNVSDAYDRSLNHTDRDTAELLDYVTLGRHVKTLARVAAGLSVVTGGLLPIALEERARDIAGAVRAAELTKVGCTDVRDYGRALAAFTRAARGLAARRSVIDPCRFAEINRALLQATARLGASLAALDRHPDHSYPHRTQLNEVAGLDAAVAACRRDDGASALAALRSVSWTSLGIRFSHAAYSRFLERLSPAYERCGWSAWGRLPAYVDVVPAYRAIQAGRLEEALADLEAKRVEALADLETRLGDVAAALFRAAADLDELR